MLVNVMASHIAHNAMSLARTYHAWQNDKIRCPGVKPPRMSDEECRRMIEATVYESASSYLSCLLCAHGDPRHSGWLDRM